MTDTVVDLIEPIRDASRRLVRELGLMEGGLAGTSLPPSAVHALLEIKERNGITAGELSHRLGLEKSSMSRVLRKLVDMGAVTEMPGGYDGRTKPLSLTEEGCGTVAAIHGFARRQVARALERLTPARRRTVTEGLRLYADALAVSRGTNGMPSPVMIKPGYQTGAIARCTEMHARFYAEAAGFGSSFEALIASGLAEFSERLDRPCNGLWLAIREGMIVGTVAIDGEDMGRGIAHLRWFIVDGEARGSGAGRELLSAAIGFCERRGFDAIHLWTFQGLHAARHLYQANGFSLVEERAGQQWGTEVLEQRFVRPIPKEV